MPEVTARRSRSTRKCVPARWAYSALLVLALSEAEAFSSGFPQKRSALVPRPRRQPHAFRVLERSHRLHKTRPCSSKFFVASTTGRSSNENNGSSSASSNSEEEVPWECIIDPSRMKEECPSLAEHYNIQQEDFGTWAKKEEPTDHVTLADKLSMAGMGLTVILSFSLLLLMSGPGAWRFFLAGGLCAATSHAIPTPIDVVKTRKQVDPTLQEIGFMEATQKIVKEEGAGALVAGLGPTVFGYMMEGAMKFGVYEVLKPTTKRLLCSLADATSLAFLRSQMIAFIVCGCVAGTAASISLAPMEALRIRLVAEPDFAPKGWIQGLRRMFKREGVFSLWRGLTPQIFKQVPYTVTKNVSFDYFTRFAYRIAIASGITMNNATGFMIPFFSAILASILSCVSSQPGDMILSLVSAHQGEFRSAKDIAGDVMRSERGFGGFFVGLKCRLYHVGIIVTLQLVLYDFLKRLCGGVATGAH